MSDDCFYTRETRYKDDDVEVVLITWPPECVSRKHDHGESHGMIRVLSGKIFEKRYKKEDGTFLGRFEYVEGDVVIEIPDIAHIMGNASTEEDAQTLHCYTPLLQMTFYDDP